MRRVEEKERRVKQERERLIQEQVDKRQHTARTVAKETFAVLRSRVCVLVTWPYLRMMSVI